MKKKRAQVSGERPPETAVIFRVWVDGVYDCIAFFPELPGNFTGLYCACYEHVGQHGAADYSGLLSQTRLATPDEYAALKKELEQIGYSLRVVRRESYKMRSKRITEARKWR